MVLCQLSGEPMPADYIEKKALLARLHIVLCDYYESAIRPDSDDNSIKNGKPNDIRAFLIQHPTIRTIAVNGYGKYRIFGQRMVNIVLDQLLLNLQLITDTVVLHPRSPYSVKDCLKDKIIFDIFLV